MPELLYITGYEILRDVKLPRPIAEARLAASGICRRFSQSSMRLTP